MRNEIHIIQSKDHSKTVCGIDVPKEPFDKNAHPCIKCAKKLAEDMNLAGLIGALLGIKR